MIVKQSFRFETFGMSPIMSAPPTLSNARAASTNSKTLASTKT